ncbi:MAG: RNA methyltransferase [Geodermatophilaceae bacterium]|nr:RNA methyltransferase [Geodermatophilaceae bacterium]
MLSDGNSRLVEAHRLTRRVRRDQAREFLAEGPQAVREAVASPGVVLEVFGTPAALDLHGDWLAETPVTLRPISDKAAAALSETVQPQGLIARCRYVDVAITEVVAAAPTLVAVLAGISDPGNAGTILRTADAAGADAVIFTQGSVDPYNGKCVRASAGSLFHLPIVRAAAYPDARAELSAAGLQVLGAAATAERNLGEPDTQRLLQSPSAWVFGSEAHGLATIESATATTRGLSSAAVDEHIRIPIWGGAESLNLAAAAAICLYASATAQRHATT